MMVDDSYEIKNYIIQYFTELTKNGNIYPNLYLWVMKKTDNNIQIKKFSKRKVMLQTKIADNDIMLNNDVYKTTDNEYRLQLQKETALAKKKLEYVLNELKKI